MSGRGGEQAYRDVISNIEPINHRWLGAFDGNLRSVPEMEDYLVQAGLEPIDIWMETRVRHTSVEAYMRREGRHGVLAATRCLAAGRPLPRRQLRLPRREGCERASDRGSP